MADKKKSVRGSHCQYCSALNCSNNRLQCPGMSFFNFPKDVNRCRVWLQNIRRLDLMKKDPSQLHRKGYCLCSNHFEDSQFMNVKEKKRLIWCAVPTIFDVPNPPPRLTPQRPLPVKRALMTTAPQKSPVKKMCLQEETLQAEDLDNPATSDFCCKEQLSLRKLNLREPPALVKATLTFELDRELFNSWCSIGTALNLTTNTQIAHHLILCCQGRGRSETKKNCGTCGAMLTLHCARCANGESSQIVNLSKTQSERGPAQTLHSPGQALRNTSGMESITSKSDALQTQQMPSLTSSKNCASSVTQSEHYIEKLVNCDNSRISCKQGKQNLVLKALHAENAVCDKGNLSNKFVVFPGKSMQPLTKQKPVKMISLLRKNDTVQASVYTFLNSSNVNNKITDLCGKKPAGRLSNQNSVKILSLLKESSSVSDTKFSFACKTEALTKVSTNNNSETDGDKSMQEGSKQVLPVMLLSLLKRSVTVPSSVPKSAELVGTSQSVWDTTKKSVSKSDTFPLPEMLRTHYVPVTNKKLNNRQSKQAPIQELSHTKFNTIISGATQEANHLPNVKNPIINNNDDDENVNEFESSSQQSLGNGNIQQQNPFTGQAAQIKDISQSSQCVESDITSDKPGCQNTSQVPYCDICKKIFTATRSLRVHMDIVHARLRPFQCVTCGQSFGNRTSLRSHQMTHSNAVPHQCGLCDKSFKTLGRLKTHAVIHSGLKDYVCEVCGKRFNNYNNLRRHKLTVHLKVKRYVCDICSKAYLTSTLLKSHMLIKHPLETNKHPSETNKNATRPMQPQLNIKRKICVTCGKSFHPCYIKLHKMTHTGEKPHVCEVCGRGYVQYQYLRQHKLMHSGEKPYVCKICNKGFSFSSALSGHKKKHDNQKQYKCEICGILIRYSSNLRRHLQIIHKKGM